MSDIRTRKSLASDVPEPKAKGGGSKESNPGRIRAVVLTCIVVLLVSLVAYQYTKSDATPEVAEPEKPEVPQPPQPGQPRPNTPPPPGQQPIPADIISG